MSTRLVYFAWMGLVLGLSASMMSCSDSIDAIEHAQTPKETLNQRTLLAGDIYLPAGTQWYYTDKGNQKVMFQLPEGYQFLLHDQQKETFSLAPSCTGDCVKGLSSTKVEGIVFTDSQPLEFHTDSMPNISEVGKAGIFKVASVQKGTDEIYRFLYEHRQKPDFSTDINQMDSDKYLFAQVYIYGVAVGFVVPQDPNWKKHFPDLELKSVKKVEVQGCVPIRSSLSDYTVYMMKARKQPKGC